MSFNIGHVEGGTNAGWRKVKQPLRELWPCNCRTETTMRLNKPYLKRCPDCKRERPE